jgi:hypothetical protein
MPLEMKMEIKFQIIKINIEPLHNDDAISI